nr:immunoglobulin light chain junction region [Macaca mulatta]
EYYCGLYYSGAWVF